MKFFLSFLILFCLSIPAFACNSITLAAAVECSCVSPVLVQSIETRTVEVPTLTLANVDVATYRLAYGVAATPGVYPFVSAFGAPDVSTMRPGKRRRIERRLERHEFQDQRDREKLGIRRLWLVNSLAVSAPVE